LHQAAARPREIFALFLLVYLSTFAGHYTSGDGSDKRAWAEAIVLRHSADVDPGPAVRYSIWGIGHTLLAIPPLVAGELAAHSTGVDLTPIFYTLLFVVNGAALMALICEYLRHDYPPATVWKALLLVGLATMWWPYTKLDFSEALVATFFFAGLVLARKGRTAMGFAVAGFAMTIREDTVILIAGLALWELARKRDWGRLVPIAAAVAPWVLVDWAANYVRWGSIVNRGYASGFVNPAFIGVYGALFSAGKSVFLFSPPLVLGVLGWSRFRDRPGFRADALLFAGIFVAQLLLFSKWQDWSGDDGWGDRFLLVSTILMCIPAVERIERRWVFATTLALGAFIQVLAVLPGPLSYLTLFHSKNARRLPLYVAAFYAEDGRLVRGGRQRLDFEDIRFNPRYSQLAGHWMLIERMFAIRGSTDTSLEGRTGTPLPVAMPIEPGEIEPDLLWLQALRGRLHPQLAGVRSSE